MRQNTVLLDEGQRVGVFRAGRDGRSGVALDLFLAAGAIGGLLLSVLLDMPVRTFPFAGSDLKTLYASTWCFVHGQDAYNVAHLQQVFAVNGVTPPQTWFGHAAVYPPMTLALLSPFAALPMVPAVLLLTTLWGLIMAAGTLVLLRFAARELALAPLWRVVIVCACAATQLLGFGLTMGNVSVPATGLSFLAFFLRGKVSTWPLAVCLAAALLLKPHLAVWVLLAMLLLPERQGRGVALRAIAITAAFSVLTAVYLLVSGRWATQVHGYAAVLAAETSSGSMDPASHEALPVFSQITSLHSLLAFANGGKWTAVVSVIVLLALAAFLFRKTLLARTEEVSLLCLAAWSAFGLLATYHRTHDAVILLLLLPWAAARLWESWRDWRPWAVLAAYAAMNWGPRLETVVSTIASRGAYAPLTFLLQRQAALAAMLLLLTLLFALHTEHTRYTERDVRPAQV